MSLLLFALAASGPLSGAEAGASGPSAADLTEISLEELLDVEVTTVSKRPERLSRAPAAVHVITREEIQRAPYGSIPELLRLVPGLQVARVDAHQWAVSARGFNDVFANKLLVMIDGRSVYTPLFSGVFWDVQDTLLRDVERIEVIRGPGATLWGANAVNGVINIITRSASETQGGFASAAAGNQHREAAFRYGGALADSFHYRVFTKAVEHDSSPSGGGRAHDGWNSLRSGLRLDGQTGADSRLMLGAEIYSVRMDQAYLRVDPQPPFLPRLEKTRPEASGGHVLARWTTLFASDSQLTVQGYIDRTDRETAIFKEDRTTFDLDLEYRWSGGRHDALLGMGYRLAKDSVENSFEVALSPPAVETSLWSAFFQDEIALSSDVSLTLGSKFEHNGHTGFEVQPGARVFWSISGSQALWGSVARAVRTPSRAEDDLRLNQLTPPVEPPLVLPPLTSLLGSREFGAETVVAYELGYRVRPAGRLTVEAAAFLNDYSHLRSIEAADPPLRLEPFPHLALVAGNRLSGQTYGLEIDLHWQASPAWRLAAGYSYLRADLRAAPLSADTTSADSIEDSDPRHQAFLQSFLELPHRIQFDSIVRFVDRLPARGIPAYTELDLRLAWRPREGLILSLVGQNLLDEAHPEFTPSFIATEFTEVQRSYHAKVEWSF